MKRTLKILRDIRMRVSMRKLKKQPNKKSGPVPIHTMCYLPVFDKDKKQPKKKSDDNTFSKN